MCSLIPHTLVQTYRSFRGKWCFHFSTLTMKPAQKRVHSRIWSPSELVTLLPFGRVDTFCRQNHFLYVTQFVIRVPLWETEGGGVYALIRNALPWEGWRSVPVKQTRSTTAAARLCNVTCVAPNLDRVATQCGLGLSPGVYPNGIPTLYSESPSSKLVLAAVGGALSLRFLSKCDQNKAIYTRLAGFT